LAKTFGCFSGKPCEIRVVKKKLAKRWGFPRRTLKIRDFFSGKPCKIRVVKKKLAKRWGFPRRTLKIRDFFSITKCYGVATISRLL